MPTLFSAPYTRGLWMIDLEAKTVEEFVSAEALQVGFPDWSDREADFDQGIGLIPQRVMWSGDGQTVIVYSMLASVPGQDPDMVNFLAVDMTTKTVTPLVDYNVFADEAAVSATGSLLPGMGLLAPDGGTLFFLPQFPMAEGLALYAAPVTLDAEPVAVKSLTPEHYDALTFQNDLAHNGYMAQAGANGNVLCGLMLFTLE